MAQVATRTQGQTQPVSPPSYKSLTINQIISYDPILSEYFKIHTTPDNYWRFSHELMLDGLRYRSTAQPNPKMCCCNLNNKNQTLREPVYVEQPKISQQIQPPKIIENPQQNSKQKNKRYNVAYVKHNRFLSPKQKKQLITPKVTEMIPTKSTPVVIYGKPRVKLDNDYGCPYHENQEQCLRSIPYGGPCEAKTPRELKNTVYEVHIPENPQKSETAGKNQLSRYKSSPNLNNLNRQQQTSDFNKTKKNVKVKPSTHESRSKSKRETSKQRHYHHDHHGSRIHQQEAGHTIYVDRIVEISSRVPGKMRVVKSPSSKLYYNEQEEEENGDLYLTSKNNKELREHNKNGNHKQAESKIKFLIERDKKNKALEKNMKKQQERIKQLEQMLIKTGNEKNKIKITAEDILSIASSSQSSQMSMMDSNVVQKFKKNMKKKQQVRKQQVRGSAAYFGGMHEHKHNQILDEEFSCSCSCSKTFNESDIDDNDPLGNQDSSVSDFRP